MLPPAARARPQFSVICVLLAATLAAASEDTVWDDESFLADPAVQELLESANDLALLGGADDVLRELAAFRENPVDVNSASRIDLVRVPTLDPAAALRIHTSRSGTGPFSSLEDLVVRGCLSREALEAARPYLVAVRLDTSVVEPSDPAAADTGSTRGRADSGAALAGMDDTPEGTAGTPTVRWELRSRAAIGAPVEESWDAGGLRGRVASYTRLRLTYLDRVSLSVTCDKDRGESDVLDHTGVALVWRHGLDGASSCEASSAAVDPNGQSERGGHVGASIGIGDFVGSWGQGLALRSGGFPSPRLYPRARDRLGDYDGAGETTARRGAFVELSRGAGTVRVVLGRTRLDAGIDSGGLVSALRTSGYHRTRGELAGKGALVEELLGARVSHSGIGGVELGGSILKFGFDPAFSKGDIERQHFRFSGGELTVGGVDVRLGADDVLVGVELSRSSDGGMAGLAAARLRSGGATARVGAGYLSREYWSPLGGGIPGFSSGKNGASAWLEIEYRARGAWRVWSSAIVARRPWRSYHLDLPDRSWAATTGGELPLAPVGRVIVETRTRTRLVEDGDPARTLTETTCRHEAILKSLNPAGFRISVFRSESAVGGSPRGWVDGVDARVSRTIGDVASVDAGATTVAVSGKAPLLVRYEPTLPGEFGLRSLNASGTRWYIRARAALGSGLTIAARLRGGPGPGRTEFGMCLDAGG